MIKKSLYYIIPLCVALAVICAALIIPLGIADGGGNYKLLESLGLYYNSTPTAGNFQAQYGISALGHLGNSNTFAYLVDAVKALCGGQMIDIRVIGALLGILLLLGLFMIMKYGKNTTYEWTNIALNCILVFIFADLAYILTFNTLTTDGLSLVLFLLIAGLFLFIHKKGRVTYLSLLPLFVIILLFAFIGTVQAWVALILGVLIIRLYPISKSGAVKVMSIICGVAVIVLSLSFLLTYKPADYDKNIYNSVFFGIAEVDNVSEIGLDNKLNELKGQFVTEDIVKQYNLEQQLFQKINYINITGYYIKHPIKYLKVVSKATPNIFIMRPSYLGNFAYGNEGKQANGFNVYSSLKGKFLPSSLFMLIIFYLLYFGVLIYLYMNYASKRRYLELFIGLGLCNIIAFKLPVILSGIYEISLGMRMFNILFDLMFVVILIAGIRTVLENQQKLKNKYGVNQ